MNLNLSKLARTSFTAMALAAPLAAIAQTNLLNLPESYSQEVTPGMIATALWLGDYESAKNLTTSAARDFIKQNIDKWAISAIEMGVDKLNKILSDSSKSDTQKQEEINTLIDRSILAYESAPSGGLNASYRYSFDFQMTRLFVDVTRRQDYCGWKTYIDNSGGSYYERLYSIRSPDISVYRLTGNERKLVATFKGRNVPYSDKYSLNPTMTDLIADWNTYRNKLKDNIVTRAAIDAPVGLYLHSGRTLSYEIVGHYVPTYKLSGTFDCGSNAASQDVTITSIINIDANADGKVDVIPPDVYSALLAKTNGVKNIAPILQLLLD